MYKLLFAKRYEKDYVLAAKRGYDLGLLDSIVQQLINGETLAPKYRNHKLTGNYVDCYECHNKTGLAFGISKE
jgi:mRNA interferase YafQ